MKRGKNFKKMTESKKSSDATRTQKIFKINLVNDKLTRKQKRKEIRKLKKMKTDAFYRKEKMPTLNEYLEEKKTKFQKEIEKKQKKKEKYQNKMDKLKEKRIQKKLDKEEQYKKMLQEKKEEREERKIIKNEEKSLRELEKKLNLNKKRKSLPQGFLSDGLDYLLDVVDGKVDSDLDGDKPVWMTESDEEEMSPGANEEELDSDEDEMMEELSSDAEDDDVLMEEMSEDGDENTKVPVTRPKSILKQKKSDTSEKKNLKWKEEIEEPLVKKKKKVKVEKQKKEVVKDEADLKSKTKGSKGFNLLFDEDDVDEDEDGHSKKDESKGIKKIIQRKDDDDDDDDDDDINKNDNGQSKKERKGMKKIVLLQDDDDDDDDVDDDEEYNDDESNEDDDEDEEEEEEILKEDIYGRVKNSDGKVVNQSGGGAYIPPARRAMMMEVSEGRKQALEKLKKQVKGLINRASEANMQLIASQVEELYLTNSRADVNHTLTELIMAACISPMMSSDRLCQELVLLISVLHNNVGMEVGAHFLECVSKEYERMMMESNYGNGKTMENILMLTITLYNFQVIHCSLVFDIMNKFLENFTHRDIELLVFIVKNVGFSLRKDDPIKLREMIQVMQTKAANVENVGSMDKSRIMFMLDVVMAIKNNNMRKLPNYDPSRTEHLKKLLRSFTKGVTLSSNQLCISLNDLLEAENKGKWWVVGSAWSGRLSGSQDGADKQDNVSKSLNKANAELLQLAQKQRMNTDTRKSIFLILMTSEDFVDAFEKLLGLGLKNQQEREIIHVIMSCCLQEKEYNPYYAYLVQKFCQFDRRFQMTFQFYLWDKFKEMSNVTGFQLNNLVGVLNHQFVHQAVTLSILKVIEFGTLDKPMVNFLRRLLEQFLLDNSQEVIESVFQKVAVNSKLNHLQEGLKLFLVHFILRKKGKEKNSNSTLVQKVEMARRALSEGDGKILL